MDCPEHGGAAWATLSENTLTHLWSFTPSSLQGEHRVGGRVHTPSRVAPSVGLHPQGSSTYLHFGLYNTQAYREKLSSCIKKRKTFKMVKAIIRLAVSMLSALTVCSVQWAVMVVWFVIVARSSGHDAKAVYDVYADLYAPANWLLLADDGVGLRELTSAVDELFQVRLS